MSDGDRSTLKPEFIAVASEAGPVRVAALHPIFSEDFSIVRTEKQSLRFHNRMRTIRRLRVMH